jgi:hypothetical protein
LERLGAKGYPTKRSYRQPCKDTFPGQPVSSPNAQPKQTLPTLLAKQRRTLFRADAFGGAGGTDFTEQEIASLLAVTTSVGANATVLVDVGVPFARFGTNLTSEDAGVKLAVDEIVRCLRLAHEETRGRGADIRAIEISADALPQAAEVFGFTQASVGTRGADFDARSQSAQRLGIKLQRAAFGVRVAAQHHFTRFHKIVAGAGTIRAPTVAAYLSGGDHAMGCTPVSVMVEKRPAKKII